MTKPTRPKAKPGRATAERNKTMAPEKQRLALENVFRQFLDDLNPPNGSDSHKHEFPALIHELMAAAYYSPRKTSPAKRGLADLAKFSGRTVDALDKLPDVAVDALDIPSDDLESLKRTLRILHVCATHAEATQKGAPEKRQARRIAKFLAMQYFQWTGKTPGMPKKDGEYYITKGSFPDLLTDVFDVLGVDASPQSQAVDISRNWQRIIAEIQAP